MIENTIETDRGRVRFVFEDTEDVSVFENIRQSYALCFNERGEILIAEAPWDKVSRFLLPGGSIEDGETPEEALHRELMEEVDVELGRYGLLGGQRCYFLDSDAPMISQLRYVGIIKTLHPLTPDPDKGKTWNRLFIKPERLNEYLQWGPIGDHLARRAEEWFHRNI